MDDIEKTKAVWRVMAFCVFGIAAALCYAYASPGPGMSNFEVAFFIGGLISMGLAIVVLIMPRP